MKGPLNSWFHIVLRRYLIHSRERYLWRNCYYYMCTVWPHFKINIYKKMAFTSDCWNHADESSSSSFRNKTFFYILLRPEDSTANERKGVWASSTSVARFLIVWWVLLYIFIILAGRICVLRFGSQGERFLPSERKQAHRNRTSSLSLSKGERRGNNNNIKKGESMRNAREVATWSSSGVGKEMSKVPPDMRGRWIRN